MKDEAKTKEQLINELTDIRQRITELEALATERRRVEEELRVKDSAIASSINGMALADLAGNLTYVNDSFLELWGYDDNKEVLGTPAVKFWQREEKAVEVVAALQAEGSWIGELVAKRKDGTSFDAQLSASMVTDEAGKPICMLASFMDITERKQVEEALRESEEKFRALLEHAPEGIVIVDSAGHIVLVNAQAEEMFGYSRAELLGQTVETLLPERFRRLHAEHCAHYFAHPRARPMGHSLEIAGRRKDGTEFPIELGLSAVETTDGLLAMSHVTDITERVAAREALKQYAQELELLNVKLTESENDLRELNATKDKFFSIISHDLRSPFSSLLGFSQILAKDYKTLSDGDMEIIVENIHNSAKHAFSLLENLLQWSRIQTGSIKYTPTTIALKEIVDSNAHLLIGSITEKDIDLFNEVEENTFVYADTNMLNSIVQNLISNAIKFTTAGGAVKITSKSRDGFIELTVADTGLGMSEETITKLFRIDAQYTTRGTAGERGTGLGLILCKEFVEKHGGQIWVESEPEVGTSVKFTLPKAP